MIYCLNGKVLKKTLDTVVISCAGVGYLAQVPLSTAEAMPAPGKEATLYTAFKRLEETGCITSYWGSSGAGARRRYYAITQTGRQTCQKLLDEWQETKEIMDKLLEVEEWK